MPHEDTKREATRPEGPANPSDGRLGRRQFIRRTALGSTALGSLVLGGAAVGSMAGAGAAQGAAPKAPAPKGTVPMRVLGATGAKVPVINLGTSQSLDETYDRVLHRSFGEGVTYIDTALSYGWGSSHRAVANFIDQVGGRDWLWLTSKSGSYSPDGLAEGLDRCLKELRVSHLDLFFMHGIDDEAMLEPKYLRLGDTLRRSGKTRFFGFSCHDGNVVELMNKAARVGGIDAIMFRYNFRRYGDMALNKAIDACHKAGIGLIAMKTMGGVSSRDEAVVGFRSKNFTLGQAKLKAVWADERIASICSEMDSVNLVRENVTAARSQTPLTANEMQQLNRLAALTNHRACQGCKHLCETATDPALRIADRMRYLMYHEAYGKQARARELYGTLPPPARRITPEELAPAAAACPLGIDIAGRLAEAEALLG